MNSASDISFEGGHVLELIEKFWRYRHRWDFYQEMHFASEHFLNYLFCMWFMITFVWLKHHFWLGSYEAVNGWLLKGVLWGSTTNAYLILFYVFLGICFFRYNKILETECWARWNWSGSVWLVLWVQKQYKGRSLVIPHSVPCKVGEKCDILVLCVLLLF